MKLCLFTHKGLEKFCVKELKEKLNVKSTESDSVVIVDLDWNEIIESIFYLQTPIRIGLLLTSFTFKTLKDIDENIQKLSIKEYSHETTLLSFDCIRKGTHDFSSDDVKPLFAKHFVKVAEINYKVPNLQLLILIIDNTCYISIDLTGQDASKRLYKVFHHSESLKGTIAASLLQFADYNKKKILIDPMMGSGIIPIEAALSSLNLSQWQFHKDKLLLTKLKNYREKELEKNTEKTQIYGYDCQFRYLKTAQKNAKLAGVEKCITLSRIDIEWLDTKHEENSVDLIVTHPPEVSKSRNEKLIQKVHNELFHQAEFILKDNGKLVCILRRPDEFLKLANHLFKLEERHDFTYGTEELAFVKLKKK